MANTAEIHIKLTGTQATTIEARAVALNKLAVSVAHLSRVARQFPSVSTAANNFARGIQNAGGAAESMGKRVKSAGNYLDNFGNLFSRMIRIMAAFTIITAVTTAFRELVTILIKAPAQLELWNTQLRTLSGSATLASERMKLLQDVAIETPLELPDLFQGLTTLQAFNVEISERTLPLIADLAAISGRTFQDISEVVGKVIQGSATAITRSLPTVGIDPRQFKALAEELGSRSEALFTIVEDRFKDFARESALTTIGIVSNIKDAFTVIAAEAGTGLLVAFRPMVKQVFQFLEAIRNDENALQEFRERLFNIGRSLKNLIEFLRQAGAAIKNFGSNVNEIVGAIGGWSTVLSALIGLKVASWLTRVGAAVLAARNAIIAAKGAVAALALALGPVSPVVLAISAAVGTAVAVYTRWKLAQGEAKRAAEELTAANALLAESVGEVNQAMMRGVDMVDASAAQRVGQQLQDLAIDLLPREGAYQMSEGLQDVIEVLQEAGLGAQQFERAFIGVLAATSEADARAIFEEALDDLFQLGEDYKAVAVVAREAADAFAAINIPSIGAIQGAGTSDIASEQIDQIRAAIQQIRNEFQDGLIDEESFVDQLFRMRELLQTAFSEATMKGRDDAGFTEVASAASAQIDVILGALDDLADKYVEIDQRAADAAQQQIERSREAAQAAIEARERFQDLLTAGIDLRFQEIQADFALGTISETQFRTAITTLISDLQARIAVAQATGNLEVVIELKTKLVKAKDLISPEEITEQISNPLESALRNAAKQATDAFGEIFGALIKRPAGVSLGDIFKRSIAGILDSMGNALIQAGLASEAFNNLLKGFGLPGVGIAAIAAGIALKAFASALGNSVRSQGASGGAASSPSIPTISSEPIDFGVFAPGQSAQGSVINLNINTIDAQGVAGFVRDNAEQLAGAVVYVAERDRATSGNAFGVFTPALGVS